MSGRMSVAEKVEIWRLVRAGVSFRGIGRQLGRSDASIHDYVGVTGGVRPRERTRAAVCLSACEREEISRGLAAGESQGTSIAGFTQEQLDEVAAKPNGRPRQTLDSMTPSEKLNEVLR